MKAALYCRVSTEEQVDGYSLSAQVHALKEYCGCNNIDVYDTYIDEGVSGQKENRPEFQRMIADAKEKRFDVILVHKFDRFARKIELSHRIKAILKSSNCNVISISEPVEDSPIGFFQEGLLELLAEYYVKNLAKEVKKGMNQRVLEGKHMGQAPYGYYIENGEIKVNESQSKIVQEIFKNYLAGWGHCKITKWLNRSGTPMYSDKIGNWATYQISTILRNHKYIGKQVWGGVLYDSLFPPIIDADMFYAAQKQLGEKASRHSYRGKNYEKFLLLGILRCGTCGKRMRVKNNNIKKSTGYHAYCCYDAVMYRNGCKSTELHRQELRDKEIYDIIFCHTIPVSRIVLPEENTDTYNKQLLALDKQLERAKMALLNGVFTQDEYLSAKNKIETEKRILNDVVKRDVSKMKPLNFKSLKKAYDSLGSIIEKKNMLLEIIECIYLYPDGGITIKPKL